MTSTAPLPAPSPPPTRRAILIALARPRLAVLGLIMVILSFFIAAPPEPWLGRFLALLAGSFLALCGASALNQVIERGPDALMRRTAGRPLPAGQISPRAAAAYGLALSTAGLLILARWVNPLTAACTALGLISYLLIYTPLKPRTTLATVVGAVPGAVPVLMGWAAAQGSLGAEAWILFLILFLWQLPHFLAIAWMYRADYARAGFSVLPNIDAAGDLTTRQVVNYGLALVPISLLPSLMGLTGALYFFGALALGLGYLACGLALARHRTGEAARRLLKASVYYLPLLFGLMALDRAL